MRFARRRRTQIEGDTGGNKAGADLARPLLRQQHKTELLARITSQLIILLAFWEEGQISGTITRYRSAQL